MKTWEQIEGWTAFGPYYDSVVRDYTGGTLVEVGNYLGRGLCYLGNAVRRSGKPFRVVGVDTCRGSGEEHGQFFHKGAVDRGSGTFAGELHRNILDCGLSDIVTLIVGDSRTVAKLFPDDSLTLVFIDAAHDYDNVKKDIEAWYPKVSMGGSIGGDDYGVENEAPIWPGVRKAVDELFPKRKIVPHASWAYRKGGV